MKFKKPIVALVCIASLAAITACSKKTTTKSVTTTAKVTTTQKATTTKKAVTTANQTTEKKPVATTYKCEYYAEKTDGTYELKAEYTKTKNGTSGQKATYDEVEIDNHVFKSAEDVVIAADGSTVVKVYYELKTASYLINLSVEQLVSIGEPTYEKVTISAVGKIGTKAIVPDSVLSKEEYDDYSLDSISDVVIAADGTSAVDATLKIKVKNVNVKFLWETLDETQDTPIDERTFVEDENYKSKVYGYKELGREVHFTDATILEMLDNPTGFYVYTNPTVTVAKDGVDYIVKLARKTYDVEFIGDNFKYEIDNSTLRYGEETDYTVTPNEGYYLSTWNGLDVTSYNTTHDNPFESGVTADDVSGEKITITFVCEGVMVNYKIKHVELDDSNKIVGTIKEETFEGHAFYKPTVKELADNYALSFEETGYKIFSPYPEEIKLDGTTEILIAYTAPKSKIVVNATNCTVNPSTTGLMYGKTVNFEITPDAGYELATVNGVAVTNKTSYSFTKTVDNTDDLTFTFVCEPVKTTYTLNHTYTSGDTKTIIKSEKIDATAFEKIAYNDIVDAHKLDPQETGYAASSFALTEYTIAYDGSTEIEITYERKPVIVDYKVENSAYGYFYMGTNTDTKYTNEEVKSLSFRWGRTVSLTAVPTNTGGKKAIFAGWYNNGELISNKATLELEIEWGKTYSIVAKFDYI